MTDTPGIPDAFNPDANPSSPFSLDLDAIENVLTLDEVIQGARLPERRVRITKRGDLIGILDELEGRLEELVDDDGQPIAEDTSLGDESEVATLTRQALQVRAEIAKTSFTFVVRSMGSDNWKAFEEQWRDAKTRSYKEGFWDALLIKSAVSPALPDQAAVDRFRKAYNANQTLSVAQAAFVANNQSGLDIPKLPPALAALKHEERS